MYEKPIIEVLAAVIGAIKFQSLTGLEIALLTVRKPNHL
jgi:hypothetical protein